MTMFTLFFSKFITEQSLAIKMLYISIGTYCSATQFWLNMLSNQSFRHCTLMALAFRTVIKGKLGTRARKEWILAESCEGQDNLTTEGNLLVTSVPDSMIRYKSYRSVLASSPVYLNLVWNCTLICSYSVFADWLLTVINKTKQNKTTLTASISKLCQYTCIFYRIHILWHGINTNFHFSKDQHLLFQTQIL